MVEEEESLRPNMVAKAVLSCRPSSHPFQERHIYLHEPVKIGRSVARARPTTSNGIFDCKVLSRHHAMLWYEAEKFYIQDTKSSNGTFINNNRLCKSGEESPMQEIFSGDIVQFGVEVMENNRRGEKITHGCIIATITLHYPDGREAKPAPFLNDPNQPGTPIQSQDLYQLARYLQEALHREKMLEQKLGNLQQLVHNTQEAAEGGWQALIDEDKLLSRLEMLENQLHIYSKNHSEDTLRQELVALQEDKINYETTAKESLRRVLQEKLDAVTKLSDLERSLTCAEGECNHLKEVCETSQEELKQLATRYQDQLKEVQELQDKLQEAEKTYQEEMERAEKEKQELMEKLEDMIQQESTLSAKIESLQADNDFAREQLAAMKAKLELKKETNQEEDKALDLGLEGITSEDIIPLGDKDSAPENLEEKLKELQTQIEVYKAKMEESDLKLKESGDRIEQLQKELEVAQQDSRQYLAKITTLEVQLKESQKQSNNSEELIQSLEDHIKELEGQLQQQSVVDRLTALTSAMDRSTDDTICESDSDSVATLNGHSSQSTVVGGRDSNLLASASSSTSASLSDLSNNELVTEAREAQKKAEAELQKYKEDMKESNLQLQKSTVELDKLRGQYFDTQQLAKEKADLVSDLQDQLRKAESATKEVKQQILDLRDGLLEEQEQSRISQEALDSLRRELESERTKHNQTAADLEDSRSQLQAAQQAAKQSHNEAEQLRTEFLALKEECSNLRKRIQAIEAEMKMSRKENLQLSSEYNKLQESYKHLEALKEKLAHSELACRHNLTDAQKDAEKSKQELQESGEELVQLRCQCQQYSQELSFLRSQLQTIEADYSVLAVRSKKISFVSSIPLLILLFAVLLALYPTLERITATSS